MAYNPYPWANSQLPNTSVPISQQTDATYLNYKKTKEFQDVGFFLQPYVVRGGEVTVNIKRTDTIDVSDIVVSLNDDVMERDGTSFKAKSASVTYFLDFKDGDWWWGNSHPLGSAGTDYLQIAVVSTDNKGVINDIIDMRGHVGGFLLKSEYGLDNYATIEQVADLATNVKDFGAVGDGVTDDTQAIKRSLFSAKGKNLLFPAGIYIITEPIEVPPNTKLIGVGGGYDRDHSSLILPKGNGPKVYTMPNVTSINVENPSVGAPYLADSGTRGDSFKTLDLTAPFSAAIVLSEGSSLENIGVVPNFDGVDGYKGTDGRLSDDWDVGVWVRNANKATIRNSIVEGHWRKSALLLSTHALEEGVIPASELCHFENTSFSGFRGVTIRNSNTDTGTTNYGFGGTDFINCYIKSLDHQSKHLATSSYLSIPFDSPSASLEVDGSVIRGVQFTNCTFMGRDDISMILNYSSELMFIGCYQEAKSIKVNGNWLNPSVGSRVVATPSTKAIRFIGASLFGVDMSPYYRLEPTADRYSVNGVFNPETCQHDEHTYPMFSSSSGMKMSRLQTSWKIWDYVFNELWKFTTNDIVIGSDVLNLKRKVNGTEQFIMRVYNSGNIDFQGTNAQITVPGLFRPLNDNTQNLGTSAARWATIFSGTGTINTSDRNEKQQIDDISDEVLDAWATVNYRQFKFNDAVKSKGDNARLHIGLIAQEIKEAFEAKGLDATKYGVLCYDEWEELPEERDSEGNLIQAAVEGGSRWGIRADECQFLELALMRRELNRLRGHV